MLILLEDGVLLWGPAGEFPATIFVRESIRKNPLRKQQLQTSGPRTDGGERFRP